MTPREPSAMVEATAIALCFNWPATAWTDEIPEDRREYWRDKARIALAAVLDHLPREAMVTAAIKSFPAGLMGVGTARQCVDAAIAAIQESIR